MSETYADDRIDEIEAEFDEFKTEAAEALEEGRFARVGDVVDDLNELANNASAIEPWVETARLNESVTNTIVWAANDFAAAIITEAQQKRWQAMPQAALVEAIDDATGLSRGSEFVAVDLHSGELIFNTLDGFTAQSPAEYVSGLIESDRLSADDEDEAETLEDIRAAVRTHMPEIESEITWAI